MRSGINTLFPLLKIASLKVFNVICEIKESCGAGPDGLEAKLVKPAAHVLMYPLGNLFNLSLSKHCVPSLWKSLMLRGERWKRGDPTDENDCRLNSIICAIAKIYEKIIFC